MKVLTSDLGHIEVLVSRARARRQRRGGEGTHVAVPMVQVLVPSA